jgi:hypothetical protein
LWKPAKQDIKKSGESEKGTHWNQNDDRREQVRLEEEGEAFHDGKGCQGQVMLIFFRLF